MSYTSINRDTRLLRNSVNVDYQFSRSFAPYASKILTLNTTTKFSRLASSNMVTSEESATNTTRARTSHLVSGNADVGLSFKAGSFEAASRNEQHIFKGADPELRDSHTFFQLSYLLVPPPLSVAGSAGWWHHRTRSSWSGSNAYSFSFSPTGSRRGSAGRCLCTAESGGGESRGLAYYVDGHRKSLQSDFLFAFKLRIGTCSEVDHCVSHPAPHCHSCLIRRVETCEMWWPVPAGAAGFSLNRKFRGSVLGSGLYHKRAVQSLGDSMLVVNRFPSSHQTAAIRFHLANS